VSKTKIALHLVKGDVILISEGRRKLRGKVELVVKRDNDRLIEVTYRIPRETGKRIERYHWREDVPLYSPQLKRRRYALLMWLSKVLRAPVKRA
jgi:hypothetical protein